MQYNEAIEIIQKTYEITVFWAKKCDKKDIYSQYRNALREIYANRILDEHNNYEIPDCVVAQEVDVLTHGPMGRCW